MSYLRRVSAQVQANLWPGKYFCMSASACCGEPALMSNFQNLFFLRGNRGYNCQIGFLCSNRRAGHGGKPRLPVCEGPVQPVSEGRSQSGPYYLLTPAAFQTTTRHGAPAGARCVVASILSFVKQTRLRSISETTRLMGEAFDAACRSLGSFATANAREAMAVRIIDAAASPRVLRCCTNGSQN